jgi:hypothetical protein
VAEFGVSGVEPSGSAVAVLVACKCQVVPIRHSHTVKMYWRVEIELHAFLISALDAGECCLHAPAAG